MTGGGRARAVAVEAVFWLFITKRSSVCADVERAESDVIEDFVSLCCSTESSGMQSRLCEAAAHAASTTCADGAAGDSGRGASPSVSSELLLWSSWAEKSLLYDTLGDQRVAVEAFERMAIRPGGSADRSSLDVAADGGNGAQLENDWSWRQKQRAEP